MMKRCTMLLLVTMGAMLMLGAGVALAATFTGTD